MNPGRRRVAVIGGGVSGLAAAYTLARARQAGVPVEETLIEADGRLGGVIRTERVDGFLIEAGPDSFLTEKPEAAAWCRELGLGGSLLGSNDAARRTYVLHRGRLVPLPDGLLMLVPARWWPLATTPLIPLAGKLAVLKDWWVRAEDGRREDESVASFVRRHFGQAMLDSIAAPLVAGVFGGDAEQLSARSALSRFWEMERRHGSLIRAVRAAQREKAQASSGTAARRPLFTTLKDGLEAMVAALEARLDPSRIERKRRAVAVERSEGSGEAGYRIWLEGGSRREADALLLALPTYEAARLVRPVDPELAGLLAGIPYAAALTVALGYGAEVRRTLPPGFGFLVPRQEGRRLLACTFVHNKFHHRAPPGHALLRCFLGGAGDPEVLDWGDGEILGRVRQELTAILGIAAEPLFSRVYRWPASMPQYVVGHEARRRSLEERLTRHPAIRLAGNAYAGVGISDCIRSGAEAAAGLIGDGAARAAASMSLRS